MGTNEPDGGEAAARTALQAMLPRLASEPHALLGVPPDASAEVLRDAFLRLTKRFHPTKFARFSPDVVRLANEVFLTIKRAYDQLCPAPRSLAQGTGVRSAVRAAGTSPPPTKPAPPEGAAKPFGANVRATTNVGPAPAPTPSKSAAIDPGTQPPRRVATPAPVPAPAPRASTPNITRPATPSPAPRPAQSVTRMPAQTTPAPNAADAEFEAALDLLRRKLFAEARQAFHKLAVGAPHDKKYRAHMHYARGRESEAAGKLDEARAEWQRALALDPEFVRAKSALADLAPAPQPSGGLFSKFFKK